MGNMCEGEFVCEPREACDKSFFMLFTSLQMKDIIDMNVCGKA